LILDTHRYFFTFFGLQRFFFFAATTPQSLQRKSPGFAFRIRVPLRQPIANPASRMSPQQQAGAHRRHQIRTLYLKILPPSTPPA
jgi:hypothetical protein